MTALNTELSALGATERGKNITLQNLKDANLIPASFSDEAATGQDFAITVRWLAANEFEYYTFLTGGSSFSDGDLATIAAQLGAYGGGIYSSDTENFRARGALVVEPLADYADIVTNRGVTMIAAGYPGVYNTFGRARLAPDYLGRSSVAGVPERNQMRTVLDMTGNAVSNASEFTPNGTVPGSGLNSARMTTVTGLSTSHASGTAASAATPNTLALKDNNGNMSAATPTANDHVATKAYVDGAGSGEVATIEVYPNSTTDGWTPRTSEQNKTFDISKGVAGDKLMTCAVYDSNYSVQHNTGSRAYVMASVIVLNSNDSFHGYLVANALINFHNTQSAAETKSNSFFFPKIKLTDGQYIRISYEGYTPQNNVYSTARHTCSWKTLS